MTTKIDESVKLILDAVKFESLKLDNVGEFTLFITKLVKSIQEFEMSIIGK